MPNANKIIDWRLTGFLMALGIFNLILIIIFDMAFNALLFKIIFYANYFTDILYNFTYLTPSDTQLILIAPQYCLAVLLALWAAMAGSPRPWRFMILALLGLHLIFMTIIFSIYWPARINDFLLLAANFISLFLVTILAAILLLAFRFWGWRLDNIRSKINPIPFGETAESPASVSKLQFSLVGMLLWTAALALLFGLISMLLESYLALQSHLDSIIAATIVGCFIIVLAPLALRIVLSERRWTTGLVVFLVLLILLFTIYCFLQWPHQVSWPEDLMEFIPKRACLITVAATIWISLQLILLRAVGYRLKTRNNTP